MGKKYKLVYLGVSKGTIRSMTSIPLLGDTKIYQKAIFGHFLAF